MDASACKAILLRKGVGSLKHLETKELWVQEVIKARGIQVVKIPRLENMSDALASCSSGVDLWAHMEMLGLRTRED